MNRFVRLAAAAALGLYFLTGCGGGLQSNSEMSFAVVGDNEVGYTAWQATMETNPSSANLPQLRQTLADIARVVPNAVFEVFTGDIVTNEAMDDAQTLQNQLDAWQGQVLSMPGTTRIPRLVQPGNHGVMQYDPGLGAQYPNPPAYDVWTSWAAIDGYAQYSGNGPTAAGENPDSLAGDESRLTYSFNKGNVHFVVIDTDTNDTVIDAATNKPCYGWIALNWIQADLAAAQANPSVRSIIVIGHRPIEGPSYDNPAWQSTILNTAEHPLAARLSQALRANSKVRVYIAGHVHSWHAFRLANGAGPWQIIAGNGGSPLDDAWSPKTYGFTVVKVAGNGRISVLPYGRPLPPAPQRFYEATPVAPPAATPGPEIVVYEPGAG